MSKKVAPPLLPNDDKIAELTKSVSSAIQSRYENELLAALGRGTQTVSNCIADPTQPTLTIEGLTSMMNKFKDINVGRFYDYYVPAREYPEVQEPISLETLEDLMNYMNEINSRLDYKFGPPDNPSNSVYRVQPRAAPKDFSYESEYGSYKRSPTIEEVLFKNERYFKELAKLSFALPDSPLSKTIEEVCVRASILIYSLRETLDSNSRFRNQVHDAKSAAKSVIETAPSVRISYNQIGLINEMKDWCKHQCESRTTYVPEEMVFVFEDANDAAAFRMKWC